MFIHVCVLYGQISTHASNMGRTVTFIYLDNQHLHDTQYRSLRSPRLYMRLSVRTSM